MAKKHNPPVAKGPPQPSQQDIGMLGAAVDAAQGGPPFMVTKASMAIWSIDEQTKQPFLAGGPYVEWNPAMTQQSPTGLLVSCRASPEGILYMKEPIGPKAPPPVQSADVPWGAPTNGHQTQQAEASGEDGEDDESGFELEDGFAIPASIRVSKGSGVQYPFENMAIGQSFFIPKTDEYPKPAKRVATYVSLASKRLAPKKFTVRNVTETLPSGGTREGARVWRDNDLTQQEMADKAKREAEIAARKAAA